MRRIVLSAGLMLSLTGCGSNSQPSEPSAGIPLSINNPSSSAPSDVAKSPAQDGASLSGSEATRELHAEAVKQLIQKASAAVTARKNSIAIESLSQAIGIQPDDANLFRMRADVYVLQGEMANARADFSTAVRLNPKNADLYNFRGYFLMSQGLMAEANQDFETAVSLNPQMAAAWNNKGLVALAQNDHKSALLDFTKAIEVDSTYVDGWNNRGFARMKLEQYEDALADVKQAIQLDDKYPTAWNNCGLICLKMEKFDEAEKAFTRLIELEPMDSRWLSHRYAALTKLGRFEDAQKDAQQVEWLTELNELSRDAAANARKPEAWIRRAQHLMNGQQYGAAIQDYTRAILVSPGNCLALAGRAEAWMKTGDMKKAMADSEEALVSNGGQDTLLGRNAYSVRGDVWFAMENYDQAIEDFEAARRFDDRVAEAYELRAAKLQEAGETANAQADRAKAREIRDALAGQLKPETQEAAVPFPDEQ
ncbi:MAG: tetratricopeptide repeat protein [Planctomycetaceae bacterium]